MIAWILAISIGTLIVVVILYEILQKNENKKENLMRIKVCKECGKRPTFTKAKGKMPTKVHCKKCDRKASSSIAPERAIQLWNNMNREEK
jgi:hypothetical protein